MAPSGHGTLLAKASAQGSFQVNPLSPVSEVHGVLSIKPYLSPLSGEKPRAVAIICNVWGTFLNNYHQQLKRGLLMLHVGIFIGCSWREHFPDGKTSFQVYMYTYTQTFVYYGLFR